MDLGTRIASWRRYKRMTQRELGDLLGLTGQAVSQWERGANGMPTGMLSRLVGAFGLTMVKFYGPIPKSRAAA